MFSHYLFENKKYLPNIHGELERGMDRYCDYSTVISDTYSEWTNVMRGVQLAFSKITFCAYMLVAKWDVFEWLRLRTYYWEKMTIL